MPQISHNEIRLHSSVIFFSRYLMSIVLLRLTDMPHAFLCSVPHLPLPQGMSSLTDRPVSVLPRSLILQLSLVGSVLSIDFDQGSERIKGPKKNPSLLTCTLLGPMRQIPPRLPQLLAPWRPLPSIRPRE